MKDRIVPNKGRPWGFQILQVVQRFWSAIMGEQKFHNGNYIYVTTILQLAAYGSN